MAVDEPTKSVVLRGALDHLADRLAEMSARIIAIDKVRKAINNERAGIPKTITSLKHQIKREEGLSTIRGIEPQKPTGYKYKAKMEFEEDKSTPSKPTGTAKK